MSRACGQRQCHEYSQDEEKAGSCKRFFTLGIAVLLYGIAFWGNVPLPVKVFLYFISYLLAAAEILQRAFANLVKKRFLDENFLMAAASLGAFAIGQYPEAVAVILFYKAGEFLEEFAVNRSRRSIKGLLAIRPDYANLFSQGRITKVDPVSVEVGQTIIVQPGERIPLDGIVDKGDSFIDASALTGEALPKPVGPGDAVYSGSISKNGVLSIKTTKKFGESTVSRILELVENTASQKASAEKFITKFARYYTPAVVLMALLIAVLPVFLSKIPALSGVFVNEQPLSTWIYRALVFLVISCPCALVISIPLGFFGGIGACSRKGILVKGANYLEALNTVDTVIWDKTGTLTKGVFKVSRIISKNGFSEEEVLRLAALAESHSSHPIAQSIKDAFKEESSVVGTGDYEEVAGCGIKAVIDGRHVLIGNDRFLHQEGIVHDRCEFDETAVHVVCDRKYTGHILISDEIKEGSAEAVENLKKAGVKSQMMLTGDNKKSAAKIAAALGLERYYAELLPQHKVEKLEEVMRSKSSSGHTVFVGDGINDAPVLMRSDIGVAMGALGSQAAIEAADIVLMNDQPGRLADAVEIAGRTRRIVWQNIIMALSVKFIFLIMGVLGIATMWEAVFADVGVTLAAILNTSRLIRE